MKLVVTKSSDNFLISNADLKNLELLSKKFPEYIGQRHHAYMDSISKDGKIDKSVKVCEVTCR